MRGVAKFNSVQLSELFVLTSDKMKLSPAIIEKDFWVCWMLDYHDEVVSFKRKFYRCSWAHYERATRGEIQLMPPEHSIKVLTDDYRHMQNMIFGDKPSFEEILDCIGKLEAEIHAL